MPKLTEHDNDVIALLETKARGLVTAQRKVLGGEGICVDRASAAIAEASAILTDAASNCRDLPKLMPVREAAMS